MAILMAIPAFSQNHDQYQEKYGKGKMPYNEKGEVVFSRVVKVDSVAKDEIYRAIKLAITDMFNSANDVIQMDDPKSCTMIAKGFQNIDDFTELWFTIRLQAKDGRYRIDIYQIKGHRPARVLAGKTIGPEDWPAEDMTYEAAFKKNGKMKTAGKGFFRRSIINGCNGLLNRIEQDVKNNLTPDSLSVDEEW